MTKGSELSILVLDDDPFMCKLLARTLAGLGYTRFETCTSGHTALERFTADTAQPDVVLLDLKMPEMDGAEFIRELVDRDFRGSLVLVSGVEERLLETAERLVHAHAIRLLGRLAKPVDPAALTALLESWEPDTQRDAFPARKRYPADEIAAAIAARQLVNHYQPQIDVATGRPVAVETLVRWQHPDDGLVFPDQFIGVAEQHGLIDELTRAVLGAAIGQARAWHDAGLHLRVAVNVSMENLASLDFPDHVVGAARAAGIDPEWLVLEVTESRLLSDQRAPLEILTRLRLNGFRLSIDDFGTGNSTLTQLRNIPFDELKIDRGFVTGAAANPTSRVIYDASLALARKLSMHTVAEGVEDRADWNLVAATGCDYAQGYLIARPMPAEALVEWADNWQPPPSGTS